MKYLQLIWASLARQRLRAALTLISITAAFVLFGLLDAVRSSFDQLGQSAAGAQRLHTGAKLSFIQSLPRSLRDRIEKLPGVADVTYASWFGGAYQDARNSIFTIAVAANYLQLYPEIELDQAQRNAFAETRNGALIGERLARRYGWKPGDDVQLLSTIFPNRSGDYGWSFRIAGIMRAADRKSGGWFDDAFLLHWKYFDDATPFNRGQVGWYVTRVSDVAQSDRVAKAIDALSANSDHATRTMTEQAASLVWIKQFADVGLITMSIMGAVFFTLLSVTGNTMMQSVRERTAELAVLKAIGFSDLQLLALVLAESLLLLLSGGVVGLALAGAVAPALGSASEGMLVLSTPGASTWLLGAALMLAVGLLVGAIPAALTMRLKVVDALTGR
ncbi:MAG: ABC transporter permease [Burkholderiaceae bacterium]